MGPIWPGGVGHAHGGRWSALAVTVPLDLYVNGLSKKFYETTEVSAVWA